MQSFDDDPDFGSQDGSSEDDQNYPVEDAEEEGEPEEDGDGEEDDEGDGESEGENDGEDTVMLDSQQPGSGQQKPSTYDAKASQPRPAPTSLGPTPILAPTLQSDPSMQSPERPPQSAATDDQSDMLHPTVRPEALTASVYDIVPTIAAPQSTSINVITATPDFRWVFSGGSDGYIRKFNWADTVNSKLMLTVAQRHPFVDSVVKAGVLSTYWENEEPSTKPGDNGAALSPVYSLAVHRHALWLLSGLDSGGINLQTVRHEEGKRIHCLKQHTSAVSVLNLAQDEKSVLSGSWDKTILDWDLNTGQVKRKFDASAGQISAIEMRPLSSLPVPETTQDMSVQSNTFSSNTGIKVQANGALSDANGIDAETDMPNGVNGVLSAPSPANSLFDGNDDDNSLFGDHSDNRLGNGSGPSFGDDFDDEFTRALNSGMGNGADDNDINDVSMIEVGESDPAPTLNGSSETKQPDVTAANAQQEQSTARLPTPLTNGLPHAEDLGMPDFSAGEAKVSSGDEQPPADTVFLAASIDGSLRIWDKRKPTPVAKIMPKNVPPWCMGACWSPDGNFLYAGRRNGTVEEYSLHKGFQAAERTFRFPQGSGPVSAVRAMPNGRHLVCASYDILRLYDLQVAQTTKHSTVPFLIVPGHRTGTISQLYVDPTCRFMISAAGNRGWEGNSTQVLLGYEVNI